ncbi:choice-of-anchor Q domain-containing protein [Spirosoma validum]|uniref:Ig-like domain-containing protein n=1 Tax=Spirosoma validum TaxID=2771355 RepID=A0A927B934_9BACT|nr:choice-of-anchor Q domain-containing protein [Spirosoma validum]MBD2757392.1 hypothetical protein [Spirosoma validum]
MTHVFRFITSFFSFLIILFGSHQTCMAQTIRYVSTTGTNSNPAGATSWATSTNSLQGAINASATGDQVWVATGNYSSSDFLRSTSFSMKNGVAIYGGFAGTETNLNQRPIVNPVTGNPSSSTLNGNFSWIGILFNSYHVINNPAGLNNTAVLDGFIITGGKADNPNGDPQNQGGGVYNDRSNPLFRNCVLTGNSASSVGGAMYNNNSSPTLINCVLSTNSATRKGGALYNYGVGNSSPMLINCVLRENTASGGGAMFNEGSSGNSSPTLINCTVQSNSATEGGVAYNSGQSSGNSSPTFINCALLGNQAEQGGVVFNEGSNGTTVSGFTNCSFQNNKASAGGIVYSNSNGSVSQSGAVLTNCVLFNNGGGQTFASRFNDDQIRATYSFLEPAVAIATGVNVSGPGNLTTMISTPFASTTSVALPPCSPATNAGNPASVTAVSGPYSATALPATDLLGNPRIANGRVDMGAAEYQPSLSFPVAIIQPIASGTALCAGSRLSLPVSVSGTGPLSYQWYKYGAALTGVASATTATLSLTAAQATDMGSYLVTVTGNCNSVTSTAFSLTINPLPTLALSTTAACVGSPLTLSATSGLSSYTFTGANRVIDSGPVNMTSVSGLSVGSYSFSVTAQGTNGCRNTASASLTVVAPPTRLYVNALATGRATGFTWADALPDLQAALSFTTCSANLTEIWVAAGTYKPTTATGPDSRTASFAMHNGLAIYGGFVGTETSLSQRNWQANVTILSGDIGTVGNNADNSYHVVSNTGLNSTAVLDGFTIRDGNANGAAPHNRGGGLVNDGSGTGRVCSPTLRNCVITGNSARFGGGLYNDGSSRGSSNPTLINLSFRTNSASDWGGAIFNSGTGTNSISSPLLINCGFVENQADGIGGAIYSFAAGSGSNSSPTLINCSLLANSAPSGGALYNDGGPFGVSNSVLTNCVVFGNGDSNTFTTFVSTSSSVTASYSLLEPSVTGYSSGPGNLTNVTTSPFVSATSVVLSSCNPAINAGNPVSVTITSGSYSATALPATDLLGNPRIANGRVDMGAAEYQAPLSSSLAFTQQPVASSVVCGGSSVSVPVSVSGTGPFSYQWYKDGAALTGIASATTATLNLPAAQATDTGSYLVVVTVGCSSITSTTFSLTVNAASRLYVNALATGRATGFTWADALPDLQAALSFTTCSANLTEIWVAAGTYKPTTATGPDSRTASFAMHNGLAIYGGFVGTETSLSQRNWLTNVTILSGDIGTVGNNADNSYHVVSNSGLNSTAVLDGFTIRDGNANGAAPHNRGGGLVNDGSGTGRVCSPTLRNCVITGNSASNMGGGIYNGGTVSGSSSPTLINCILQGNSASQQGGALHNDGSNGSSSPLLINCAFVGNRSDVYGGAIYNSGYYGVSSPTLINCSLQNNSSTSSGSAMLNFGLFGISSPVLTNCVVFGNEINNLFGSVSANYSLFESGMIDARVIDSGQGNLATTVSPFLNPTSVVLTSCSPAINAGNPASVTVTSELYSTTALPPVDLLSNQRIFGGRVDMGAIEYQAASTVVTITNPTTTTASVGIPFSQTFSAAGGSAPYSFSLTSSPPPGLSMVSTGVLSGTPTQAGSFTLTVLSQDVTGCSGMSAPYVLTVNQPAPPRPDLSPLLYARPTLVYGQSTCTVMVDVVELNSVATSGSFTVRLTKDQLLKLTFDVNLSSLNGRAVQNSVWRFSDSDPNYYVLTTSQSIAAGEKLSFGLSGSIRPGASTGILTISATVLPDTLVEGRLNNNIDADKIEYFQQ